MIAFDASSVSSRAATPVSWNHTCTGSNLYLLVGVYLISGNGTTASVTYNGVSMTQLVTDGTSNFEVFIFGLANPATGTHSIQVSSNQVGGTILAIGASYTGAAQTGQPDSFGSHFVNTVGTITASSTVVAANCWVASFACEDGGTTVSASTGVAIVRKQDGSDLVNWGDSNGTVATGSYSTTWTQNANASFSNLQVSIAPVASVSAEPTDRIVLLGVG